MAFLTENEFRSSNLTASATEVSPQMVNDCLQTAIDELTGWCGEGVITEVENANGTADIKVRKFRKAQDKLAFCELLGKISGRFRSGGIQISEKDMNDSATNTFEKFSETEARIKRLKSEAKEQVKAYLLPVEDNNNGSLSLELMVFSTTVKRKVGW